MIYLRKEDQNCEQQNGNKYTYQQLNLKNKLSKLQNKDRIMDTDSVLMVVRWEGSVVNGWKGEGIRKYKQVVTE